MFDACLLVLQLRVPRLCLPSKLCAARGAYDLLAVMHNEACETSWRPAGFRVINHTCYLATCAQEGHACRLEHEADPPLLCHKTPELLRDHKAVVTAVCTAYTSAKAAKLLRDKAPLDSSQWVPIP